MVTNLTVELNLQADWDMLIQENMFFSPQIPLGQ